MNIILFDPPSWQQLLPLTFARPVGDLRMGSLTVAEKWALRLGGPVSFLPQDYLRPLFPVTVGEDNLLIDATVLPSVELISFVRTINNDTAFFQDDKLVVARLTGESMNRLAAGTKFNRETLALTAKKLVTQSLPHLPYLSIHHPADLFTHNDRALREDFELCVAGRTSSLLSATNRLIGPPDQLFIEAGASIEGCTINVESGPVYIGKDAVILEGCLLRGPIAINEQAVVKMGAKIYGGTTIGPACKVGGEISNVIFQANSNKGHDGYLGNAVIGEWCNLGADTNASNLKNDYGNVKSWSYAEGGMRQTGLQFHGLIMGDHSKTGINTMLNTGTVVGFSANIFGAGFPPAFLPSFTWGGAAGTQEYRLDKAMATAERVMQRRNRTFTANDRRLFEHLFTTTARYRS